MVAQTYGQLIQKARRDHAPPLSAKELANLLGVSPPFITDIEKGRRLPSLGKQKQIKQLLACSQYPEELFDDLAASDNPDIRIVAEDIAQLLRTSLALREMLRTIQSKHLTNKQIREVTAYIGGTYKKQDGTIVRLEPGIAEAFAEFAKKEGLSFFDRPIC